MKINSITQFSVNKLRVNKQENGQYNCAPLKNDAFVKSSQNVSFGAAARFAEKFIPFAYDMRNYIVRNDNMELSQIEKIVKKYSPTTVVKKMEELKNNANVWEQTCAYFSNMLYFSNTGEIVSGTKEIFINMPKNSQKVEKLSFLDSILHEATHIFQEESKDRKSKVQFLNEWIAGRELTPQILQTVQVMPKAYMLTEREALKPISMALNNTNNIPRPIIEDSKELLDTIHLKIARKDTNNYVDTIIKYFIENFAQQGFIDKKKVAEFISHVAEKEKEAHGNSLKALKNEMNMKEPSDLDLLVRLYDTLAKRASEIAKDY